MKEAVQDRTKLDSGRTRAESRSHGLRSPWASPPASFPGLIQQVWNGPLTQALQVWEYRGGRTHACLEGRDACYLGRLSSGWRPSVPCLSFKNDYCVFHKGTSICQEKRLAVPIETGQNLSSWGDPGPSF